MILVTGGLGFIGSHVARSLLDLGESCVLTRHRSSRLPDFIDQDLGTRAFIEPLDVNDAAAFVEIGRRHEITGIVHLAGGGFLEGPPIEHVRTAVEGLLNVLQAAEDWGVARVSIASTVGVYAGRPEVRWQEELPLPIVATHPIPTMKKCFELLGSFVGSHASFEVVSFRPSAIWGPLGRPESRFFATPRLVHAAASGEMPDSSSPRQPVYAEDGVDMCYVKDCGRAIALLQTAAKLNHRTYNIGSGRAATYREVAAAIERVMPDARVELAEGRTPDGPAEDPHLDITRLREDTGYEVAYDVERGVADYIEWLRTGRDR